MSWEAVDQAPTGPSRAPAPVSLSLMPGRGGRPGKRSMLYVTIDAASAAQLCWAAGITLGLEVGRAGLVTGWVRLSPGDPGRMLRALPRSGYLSVGLAVPPDIGAWKAPRQPAEFKVLAAGTAKGPAPGMLLAKLPWDLSGDPAAAQQEEAA